MWSLTSPIARMNAYTVGGPTHRHPRRLRSFARARRFEPPHVRRQRPLGLDQLDAAAGVRDHSLDLAAVADDRGVGQQSRDVAITELGDDAEVEPGERAPERLALAQDREPRQSGLEALER